MKWFWLLGLGGCLPDGSKADSGSETPTVPLDDTGTPTSKGVDNDNDGYPSDVDCDDSEPVIHPGALEVCDAFDNDCDPVTNDDGVISLDFQSNHGSISEALAQAASGSTITVCRGDYAENLHVEVDDLRLIAPDGPDVTSLSGGSRAPVIQTLGDNLLVAGFDIHSGVATKGDSGGGIDLCMGGATGLRVETAYLHDNIGSSGGAICADTSTVILRDVELINNYASKGGGAIAAASLDAEDVELLNNDASEGGGILLTEGIHGVRFIRSKTGTVLLDGNGAETGGGLYLVGNDIEVSGLVVQNHDKVVYGAGVFVDGGALTIEDVQGQVVFSNSYLINNAALDQGGNMYVTGTSLVLEGVDLNNGWAIEGGGGYLQTTLFELNGVGVGDNGAKWAGGGLFLQSSRGVMDEGCLVENNTSLIGGGTVLGGVLYRLESIGAGWGTDGRDNSPDDVGTDDGTSYDAANGSHFVCERSGSSSAACVVK